MSLLVICDHDRGKLAEASLEALAFGRSLATSAGLDLEAVVVGEGAESAAVDLAAHGASTVHVASHELLTDFGPEAWGETVTQLVRSSGAEVVLACGTDRGNEVVAHVAARLDQPFVANCRSVEPDAGDWTITRVQWGGSLLEDVSLTAEVVLVTVAHHAVEPSVAAAPAAGVVAAFRPDLDASLAHTVVADRVVLTRGVTLSTAPVVVGGGRGVGSAEAFGPLEELAGLLGGVVGCSRAVTNNGWRPHSDQVG
ncbi:MAG TPA: electron transfer flavoprotein subunit alpha/FixB family protein, partial [Acidimicrobiaceae bacterium]|nr:electron transfer flavoprotein subunit alpha/FixB family protein [Acidimicrobiaceae bacterium]